MPKIPVDIGALQFASKGDAQEHFRQILYRHEIGSRIPEPDATDLASLLARHPEFADKVGCGVDYFSIRSAIYGTKCFEVVRTDASRTDFSFRPCLSGKPPAALSQAVAALRAEVADDIFEKKRDYFRDYGDGDGKVRCALTGERITIQEAHADHAPPRTFGTLAITFIEARGIDPANGFVTAPADNQYEPRLIDRKIAEEWRTYHHRLAAIRIVAKQENLSRSHEGKVKDKDVQLRFRTD